MDANNYWQPVKVTRVRDKNAGPVWEEKLNRKRKLDDGKIVSGWEEAFAKGGLDKLTLMVELANRPQEVMVWPMEKQFTKREYWLCLPHWLARYHQANVWAKHIDLTYTAKPKLIGSFGLRLNSAPYKIKRVRCPDRRCRGCLKDKKDLPHHFKGPFYEP